MFARKRIKAVRQEESSECILACLAMIMQYHGSTTKLRDLRKSYPSLGRGGSLRDLLDIAQKLHLAPRPLKADIENLSKLSLPCIIHWNFDHFVVLEKLTRDGIRIADPAKGTLHVPFHEVSRRYTGIAVELAILPSFNAHSSPSTGNGEVQQFLSVRPYFRSIALFSVIAAISLSLTLIAPLSIQLVVDKVLPNRDLDLLALIAIGFFFIHLLGVFANYVQQIFILRASSRLRLTTIYEFYQALLGNGLEHFGRRGLGHFVAQFNSISYLIVHVVKDIGTAIVDLIYIVIVAGILLFIDFEIALVVVAASTAVMGLRWALIKQSQELQNKQIIANAQEESYFVETLRGIYSVKANRLELHRILGGIDRVVTAINASFAARRFDLRFETIVAVAKSAESILILYLLAKRVLEGNMTIGVMYTFYMYRVFVDERLANYIGTMANILNIRVHQKRLAESMDGSKVAPSENDISSFLKFRGDVELVNISFSIDNGRRKLFEQYSAKAEARSFVHISGPSGIGKSTLLKILLRIVEPDRGEILVDGRNIGAYSQNMVKSSLGVVLQEDTLFGGSIISNVSSFDDKLDFQRVQECCELCEVHEEICRLPLGYHSLVGDMGASLSSGQQQRLLLARALYKNPTILLLDEATANLNADVERKILSNLKALNKTIIFASHSAVVPEFRDVEWTLDGGT
ncbi:peptidase domain-containing ABC transporter [Rhizobium anhuiense]|nr:peptidase domain-containing ABC transporter [Rhizobium anhuiense]